MEFEKVLIQFVFRRAAEELHVASHDDAEEWPVVLVDVLLPLIGSTESFIVVEAIYPRAFEPIWAIEPLQSL